MFVQQASSTSSLGPPEVSEKVFVDRSFATSSVKLLKLLHAYSCISRHIINIWQNRNAHYCYCYEMGCPLLL